MDKEEKFRYIIEDLIPEGNVNLIGGPSGSGKTTLMFQLYKAIENNGTWLGREVETGLSWAYVSGDRAEKSVRETQDRIGVKFPIFSLVDRNLVGSDLTNTILPQLKTFLKKHPDLVYIDGFTGMVPGGKINDYDAVSKWLASLQRYCVQKKLTILGACHTTKTKKDDSYTDMRQKIAGSVAWGAYSEGVVIIDPPAGDAEDQAVRNIYLLPRNKPPEHFTMHFDEHGLLQMPEKIAQDMVLADMILPALFRPLDLGKLDYNSLMMKATSKGLSRRTFDRYIKRLVDNGKIERVGKGRYEVLQVGCGVDDKSKGVSVQAPEESQASEAGDE